MKDARPWPRTPPVMPNAGARAATARPIRPRPMMPSCLPPSSMPSMKSSAQPFHAAAPNQPLAFPDASRDRQDERPRELGGRLREHVRRVRDDDAARACGGNIDVVVADGDVRHDFEIGRRVEHVGVDRIGQDAHQPLFPLQSPHELVGGQGQRAVVQLNAAAGLELRLDRRRDPAGQQNAGARISARGIGSNHNGCSEQPAR